MTTWRREIEKHLGRPLQDGDVSNPPIGDWMDKEFDDGSVEEEAQPFCLWTPYRVVFPLMWGAALVDSVPRNPSYELPRHI